MGNQNNNNNPINDNNGIFSEAPPAHQNDQINMINESNDKNIIYEEENNNENNASENKINEETNNGDNNNENKINENNNDKIEDNQNIQNDNSDCPVPVGDLNKYEKHFSFNNLMQKIKETAKKAGLKAIYMALLLYYALESPTISVMDKAIIYGALGYFISPIDIIPDILPLVGLTDDIAVLAWAFNRIKHNVTDLTREKAKTKLKIWFGNFNENEIDDL